MKKSKFFFWGSLLVLLAGLQACVDLDDDSPQSTVAIATVRMNDPSVHDFYFLLDNGETMFPADTLAIKGYPLKDGKRAYVFFNFLEEQNPAYDYAIQVNRLDSILTKPLIPITAATADSIGDDCINLDYYWAAQGYLNLQFSYYGTLNPARKHMLNLVYNPETPVDEDGYLLMEFRHNAYDDFEQYPGKGLVSFRLQDPAIDDLIREAKGIRLRVKGLAGSVRTYTIQL